ncbi:hypothetical protein LTR94_024265 [Friedmanniomyces endolithicus]|nr:hypothetical protein LTR94_024265 [Friedmanniomyces endolithicus]
MVSTPGASAGLASSPGGEPVSDRAGDLKVGKADDGLHNLYRAYSSWLRQRLRARYGEAAEDLAQEAWLRNTPYCRRGLIDHPKALLLRIADNLAIDQARRSQPKASNPRDVLELPSEIVSAEQMDLVLLKQIVLAMPEPLRSVFVLSRFAHLEYQVIIEAVGDGNVMRDPQRARTAADREAADWHARLGERPVAATTLEDFRVWREAPGNADAYRRVEAVWRATGSLSSDADIQVITRDTLHASSRRRPSWYKRLFPAVAVLAPVAAAIGLFIWLPTRGSYETGVGQQHKVELADGSRIHLDTDTQLKVRYGDGERRILLERGQALFSVAHDPERPFTVQAGHAEVTALGTVFDVRRETTGARVTLVEGVVSVKATSQASTWRLAPGDQL